MAAAVNNTVHAREVTEALNEVKFSGFHLRAIITAGMGFSPPRTTWPSSAPLWAWPMRVGRPAPRKSD